MTRIHFSHLRAMSKSPAHYLYARDVGRDDTRSLKGGRLVHKMALGYTPLTVYKGSRRGKAWEEFRDAHDGAEIFTASEVEQASQMADALNRNERALRLLTGHREQTLQWRAFGLDCEGTPDVFTQDYVVELKTGRTSQPDQFMRQAQWYGYHAQLAWYLEGVRQSGLGTPDEAYIVAVESSPPYPVTCIRLTEHTIEMGRRACRLWAERLRVCMDSNHWPEYAQGIVDWDIDEAPELTFGDEAPELTFGDEAPEQGRAISGDEVSDPF